MKLWDKRLKCFHELYDLYEVLIGNIPSIFTNRQEKGTFWDREDFEKRFIQCDSTGLKDKNSKKIYEGDIVKIRAFDTEHITEVLFKDGMFGIQWKDYTSTNAMLKILGWFTHIEVIGNIYENPELLKNVKCSHESD